MLADRNGGRLFTAADARCCDHTHVLAQNRRQLGQQFLRPRHLARQAIADTHRQRRGRCITFLDHIEVVIEGRDFIDLRLRQPHLARQRRQMARAEVAEAVLQAMQMLDQQVVRARRGAEQCTHLFERSGIDDAALRRLALALPGRTFGDDGNRSSVHQTAPSARNCSTSAAEKPNCANTCSVCSPSSGERVTSVGLSDSLIGLPTDRYLPRAG